MSQAAQAMELGKPVEPKPSPIQLEGGLVHCKDISEAHRFGAYIVKSGLAPKCFTTPEAVLVAVQMGAELGLKPMQALQTIAVINGKPALWGKGLAGVVLASGKMENFKEWFEGEGDSLVAVCEVKRKGIADPRICRFSMADAKKAGLTGKGTWTSYAKDMLMYKARARAFTLFSDVLCGLPVYEDIQDGVVQERRADKPAQPINDPLLKQATVVTAEVEKTVDVPGQTVMFEREPGDESEDLSFDEKEIPNA